MASIVISRGMTRRRNAAGQTSVPRLPSPPYGGNAMPANRFGMRRTCLKGDGGRRILFLAHSSTASRRCDIVGILWCAPSLVFFYRRPGGVCLGAAVRCNMTLPAYMDDVQERRLYTAMISALYLIPGGQ